MYRTSVHFVSGADGFTSEADQDEVRKIEGQLKKQISHWFPHVRAEDHSRLPQTGWCYIFLFKTSSGT